MRKVKLRMNEYHKYFIIKNLVDNGGNKNNGAIKLNLSRRQIDRLIIKYKEKGKSGFVHGNRGHKPTNTLDLIKQIKKYIPPMNHSWRVEVFKRQQQKAHTIYVYA